MATMGRDLTPPRGQAPDIADLTRVQQEWTHFQQKIRQDLEDHLAQQDRLMGELLRRSVNAPHINSQEFQEFQERSASRASYLSQGDLMPVPSPMSTPMGSPMPAGKDDCIAADPRVAPGDSAALMAVLEQENSVEERKKGRTGDGKIKVNLKKTALASILPLTDEEQYGTGIQGKVIKCVGKAVQTWDRLQEPPRTGFWAEVDSSFKAEFFSTFMVITNCCFIVYSKNWSMQHLGEAPSQTVNTVEMVYTCYFLMEILMKIWVHGVWFFCNDDMGWNLMDLVIVATGAWTLASPMFQDEKEMNLTFLRSLRILKLAKILRLLRMVRVFNDLRLIVVAFLSSLLALFWCFVLLLFMVMIFAMLFVQMVEDFFVEKGCKGNICELPGEPGEDLMYCFGSVEAAMLSLYMATTGGNDWSYYYDQIMEASPTGAQVFIFFTAFYYFGIFNLLTGIFVDKAVRASRPDGDLQLVETRGTEDWVIEGFMDVLLEIDPTNDGFLNDTVIHTLLQHESGLAYLQHMAIENKHALVVYNSLRAVDKRVPMAEFVTGCLRVRGSAITVDLHSLAFGLARVDRLVSELKHNQQNHPGHHVAPRPRAISDFSLPSGALSGQAMPHDELLKTMEAARRYADQQLALAQQEHAATEALRKEIWSVGSGAGGQEMQEPLREVLKALSQVQDMVEREKTTGSSAAVVFDDAQVQRSIKESNKALTDMLALVQREVRDSKFAAEAAQRTAEEARHACQEIMHRNASPAAGSRQLSSVVPLSAANLAAASGSAYPQAQQGLEREWTARTPRGTSGPPTAVGATRPTTPRVPRLRHGYAARSEVRPLPKEHTT